MTDRIIETFNAGSLELDPETAGGVTLRSYLSEKLGCDPMRITKKYTGASCLGKRVYHSANTKAPREVVDAVKVELALLEEKFREKLEKNCRDRLGLEADVDKHLRNQVVSTPSIDAMMMQGSSGSRKSQGPGQGPPTMMMQRSGNVGYWSLPVPMIPAHAQSSSSSYVASAPLSMALPSSYGEKDYQNNYESEIKMESSSEQSSFDKYSLKDTSDELSAFESMISSTETAIGCERIREIREVVQIKPERKSSFSGEGKSSSGSRSVSFPTKSSRKVTPHFPYSRYHDPITPVDSRVDSVNVKGGFELSASSYYYAPSAQEIEASKVQQQKQQQHHMLILQQQQQQQKQQYYLSLEKSSDLFSVPKTNLTTHCVPTLANIGGVKRKDSNEGPSASSESQSKMHKIENRNRNELPIDAFLKSGNGNGNIRGGKVGHGQGAYAR